MRRFLPFALLALAACSQSSDDAASEPVTVETSATNPTPAAKPSGAAVSAHLALAPLENSDGQVITESMENVGGCGFTAEDGRLLLSVGTPDSTTAPGIGVARPAGRPAKLTTEKGGMAYVEGGPVLTFEGLTLTVRRDAGEGERVGIETTEWPASLVASDADGNSKTYSGNWSCGV